MIENDNINAYREIISSGKIKKLNFSEGIDENDFVNLNIFSILIQENTIVWNFLRKFSYGDNMKIDYSTNINFFKLTEIENTNNNKNNYIFELSKEAITCLTNIFKNYGATANQLKNNKNKGT